MTSPSLEEAKRGYLSAMWEQVPQLNNVDWRRAVSCWRWASAYAIKSYMSTFNVCMWKYVSHKDKCVPLLLWKWGCRMTCSFCPVVFSWSKSCLVGEVCCWVSALLRWPTFLCSGGPSRQHLNSRATQRVSLLLQRFEKFIWGRSVCAWNLPSWCRKVTLRCPLSCFLILRVLKPVLAGFITNFFGSRLFLCAC